MPHRHTAATVTGEPRPGRGSAADGAGWLPDLFFDDAELKRSTCIRVNGARAVLKKTERRIVSDLTPAAQPAKIESLGYEFTSQNEP